MYRCNSWQIIGRACYGEELLRSMVCEHKPHVAIIDIDTPGMNGLQDYQVCKDISLDTQWIILTEFTDFHEPTKRQGVGVARVQYSGGFANRSMDL
nr:hypothetical protein [Paenibacillus alba]